MSHLAFKNEPTLISEEDLERQLILVRATAAHPLVGLFGPDSLTWRVEREAVLFLGAGRALLLQLAHPWIASAIADHSPSLMDPLGRFHRTFSIMFSIVFGTLDQALGAARQLYRRHATIEGTLTASAGPFPAGSPYYANELAALRWVWATLTETAVLAHDLVLPPLTDDERQRYYAESQRSAALFGIPATALPADWAAFMAYNEAMWQADTLKVVPAARAIADRMLHKVGRWLRVPAWYRVLTARLLPRQLREAFRISYQQAEQDAAERALARVRRIYPLLPKRLRYVGPYQEAQRRLTGRTRPDLITQGINQLWIGRRWLT
jgi:uncharacterized protein (DUF2236 family)